MADWEFVIDELRPESSTPSRSPRILATVDVGSNSTHLLVAIVTDRGVLPIEDQSVLSGLAIIVDHEGRLPSGTVDALTADLTRFRDLARGSGAQSLTVVATEPLRRAANAAEVAARVVQAIGEPLRVLSHEEEALLTLLGATNGDAAKHRMLVVDIGGGSSEFAVTTPGKPPIAMGLLLGSSRLMGAHVTGDPPTEAEFEAMCDDAAERLRLAPDADPEELILVGGTASNLLRVPPVHDPIEGRSHRLDVGRLQRIRTALLAESADKIAVRYGVRPARARMLPAGAAIVSAMLRRYGRSSARVSDHGLREGVVTAVARAGPTWHAVLSSLVHSAPHDADRE